jgi:uncharacterized membrane protein
MHPPHTRPHSQSREAQLARRIGWFSVGLGVAQLLAPRVVSRIVGVNPHPLLMRALGVRELISGVGILTNARPGPWLWGRVAGDAMDLALLGTALRPGHPHRAQVLLATTAAVAISAVDLHCAEQCTREVGATGLIHVKKSIGVQRPPEELYDFWRDFTNLPRVMSHLRSVSRVDELRSHWVAEGPGGAGIEWDAEVIDDVRNERIAWRSMDGSDIYHAGSVRFAPAAAGRGSLITVHLAYRSPGGSIGSAIARIMGREPAQEIDTDLRAFKAIMETGEIATTRGQPAARTHSVPRKYALLKRALS